MESLLSSGCGWAGVGSAAMMLCALVRDAPAAVVAYPAPPGLAASPDFMVTVNGTPIWVERIGSARHSFEYPLYAGRAMEDLNVASFSCSGPVAIKITAAEAITSAIMRPKHRGIAAQVWGREITFTLPGPQKLYIEINGLPHLALIANPPEVNPPEPGGAGVVYFGPGNHHPGEIVLQSGQTLYLAGGALVNANIRGSHLQNVRILGRGMLQGNIRISDATNLEVDGIFVRNTSGWSCTLTNCRDSRFCNVKVFGYEAVYSVDGINPVSCTRFTIDDCFIRCRDDCVAIKATDKSWKVDSITVMNCVMVGWACSDGVTLGFELHGTAVENVLVKNCDILYARGGGKTGGHAGFGIVCDGPAWVRNIRFEDLRVEAQVEFKNLELIVTDGTLYGTNPPGHIQGVYLKDIAWENPAKPFILSGLSAANLVEDVTFEHCTVGGKALAGFGGADFRVNAFVRNVRFLP